MKAPYGLGVLAAALAAHAYAVTLPFQLDDFHILPNVGLLLDPGRWNELDLAGGYAFRPTAWVLWATLIAARDGVASAPLLHAALLVLHAVTAYGLFRTLSLGVDMRAAAVAGVVFAVVPGGAQAFTWVAAGGDQLATAFLVVIAWLSARRAAGAGAWSVTLVGVAGFLGFLSKETFLLGIPAALLGAWLPNRDAPARRRAAASVALGAVVGVAFAALLRWRIVGLLAPVYAFDLSLDAGTALRLHEPALQMLAAWSTAAEYAAVPPLGLSLAASLSGVPGHELARAAASMAFLVPVAAGLLARPSSGCRAIALVVPLALVLLPAAAVWRAAGPTDNTWSRALYAPSAVAMAMLAIGLDAARGRVVLRRVALLGAAVLLAVELDVLAHFARSELLRAEVVDARVQSLGACAEAEPPDALLVAIDPLAGMGGMPLLGPGAAFALKPPFSARRRDVVAWAGVMPVSRAPAFWLHRGPLVVLHLVDGRFMRLGEPLSALPDAALAFVPAAAANSFTARPAMPRRGVRALAITAVAPQPAASSLRLTWDFNSGEETSAVTLAAGATRCVAFVPECGDALAAADPRLRGVRVEGVALARPPEALCGLETIGLMVPPAERIVRLGHKPEIRFAPKTLSPIYRITYELAAGGSSTAMVYNVPVSRTDPLEGGVRAFIPGARDHVTWPGRDHVTWDDLPAVFRRDPGLPSAVSVNVHVTGLAADGVTPEAESAWESLVLLCNAP